MPRHRHNPFDRRLLAQVEAQLQARDQHRGEHPERHPLRLELTNKAKGDTGPAVLRVYDAIGGWFGITASDIAERLDDLADDRDLIVRINSPGGSVFDGTAIYNLLATWQGTVDVVVDGLAASAASFIAQAGDTITMQRGTQMMIHDGAGVTIGNAADHRYMADLLDSISDEIAGIYAARAGLTRAEWRDKMREESWYNAEAAVDAGLADKTADAEDEEEAEKAAASWGMRPTAALTAPAPAPAPAPASAEDVDLVLDELDDELFTGLADALDEVFDPMGTYDPDVVAGLIQDVYADAPAPPAVDPGPPRERTAISIDEFVNDLVKGLQEGVRQ